jgi:DNA topoisomerase-1
MAKAIVIVESPAKAKTIEKYLGKDYVVKASAGHIKDLPARALGVDIKNGFRPTYRIIPGKEKIVRELRKSAEKSEIIYLAADPDREGEAICQHLAEELNGRDDRQIYRVLFNEITKSAIIEAFRHPSEINQNKVSAQRDCRPAVFNRSRSG